MKQDIAAALPENQTTGGRYKKRKKNRKEPSGTDNTNRSVYFCRLRQEGSRYFLCFILLPRVFHLWITRGVIFPPL